MLVVPLVVAAASLLITYFYTKLRSKRFLQFSHLPQLPPSLLWGHMLLYDDFTKRGPPDRHPDLIFNGMLEAAGRPPLMVVDMRPVAKPVALITSHGIAEQIAKASPTFPSSPPKTPTMVDVKHLIGAKSILSAEGEDWKALRKRFAPGFASSHLLSLLPRILDKLQPTIAHLEGYARTQQVFPLQKLMNSLTIDIISLLVIDEDFHAQDPDTSRQAEIVIVFRKLLETYTNRHNLPWWLAPGLETKRRRLSKRIQELFHILVQRKFDEYQIQQQQEEEGSSEEHLSILSLSFKGIRHLTPEVLESTSDQLLSFFFAGNDTTSIILSWIFYELSLNAHAKAAVDAELNELLGPDSNPAAVQTRLRLGGGAGQDIIWRMTYVSAVIKETLRLHPPASTARYAKPGDGFTVQGPNGEQYCLDGTIMYNCHTILHRDPAVYGDSADDFVPERWLDVGPEDRSACFSDSRAVPPSAWRPFERGPRSCIGQELAVLEARVVVAVLARHYDFNKVGLGEVVRDQKGQPVLGAKGRYQVRSELYPMLQVTTKPVDGMMMRVGISNSKEGRA